MNIFTDNKSEVYITLSFPDFDTFRRIKPSNFSNLALKRGHYNLCKALTGQIKTRRAKLDMPLPYGLSQRPYKFSGHLPSPAQG